MPKPRNLEELRQWLAEQGEEDLADSILPLADLASPELLERYPQLKDLALVALTELTDEEVEEMLADWDEEEEGEKPTDIPRVMGMPNLTEKASMCELTTFEALLAWLEEHGVRFEE